jgi:glycosyltransferase involved in cell wall biosynthesis
MDIFSSTIIPTINRSTLSRAVQSVLDQSFNVSGYEVIVVNDSGHSLPEMEWQQSERVIVINTNRIERSVARNTGAAIAKGKYLHFLDDDDLMMPGALDAFWRLDRESPASWLYGSYQTVDNQGNLVNEFCPELKGNIFAYLVAGEGIPFQASLVNSKSFFAAGAFDPKISVAEDSDLGRRIAFLGTVSGMSFIAAKIRVGELGSTTAWSTMNENYRWGREKALQIQNAFFRLRSSAITSYWRGRVSRVYFASSIWNLKRKSLFIATSRFLFGLAIAGRHPISKDFWNGLGSK